MLVNGGGVAVLRFSSKLLKGVICTFDKDDIAGLNALKEASLRGLNKLSLDIFECDDIMEVGVMSCPETLLMETLSLMGENTWLPRLLSCSTGALFSFKLMSFKRFLFDTLAESVVTDDSDPVDDRCDRLLDKDDSTEDKLALSMPG